MVGQLLNDKIRDEKWRLISEIVTKAKEESPFYLDQWRHFDTDSIRLPEQWDQVPFTTREQITSCNPFHLLWKSRKNVQAYYESSGTTGNPVPGFPDLSFEKAVLFGKYLDEWMGLTKDRVKTAVVALVYELNPTGIRFQMALPTIGITVIPFGARSTVCTMERQVRLMRRMDPDAMFSRPFEILRLADCFYVLGTDNRTCGLSKLFYTGEIVSYHKLQRMSECWNDAEVYGHYGLTEIDSGLQLCSQGRYHEPATPYLHVEIIDENGSGAVEDGQCGEIVLTSLRPEAMPLIRYRTEDIGFRHPGKCPCGNATASYTIMGRKVDSVEHGEGRIFPIEIEDVLFSHPDIGNEYQIHLLPGNRLKIVAEQRWGTKQSQSMLEQRLVRQIQDRFGLTVQAEVREFGKLSDRLGIPKVKSGRFIDLRCVPRQDWDAYTETNCVDGRFLKVQGKLITI
ncbi:phenylacetate--CoA ligase family protein [Cohnella laeviribosi]|uniref:phenylacetate--CoA ligase family protein n=1 Tax=Cohnella laeviribosi TaxID=380174 RepID=UPI000374D9FB|nr:phenylacetate--CoA ligase family protein [Cohnella laeviribosi]